MLHNIEDIAFIHSEGLGVEINTALELADSRLNRSSDSESLLLMGITVVLVLVGKGEIRLLYIFVSRSFLLLLNHILVDKCFGVNALFVFLTVRIMFTNEMLSKKIEYPGEDRSSVLIC